MTRNPALLPLPLLLALPVLLASGAPPREPDQARGPAQGLFQGTIAVDRWLVSDPGDTEGEVSAVAREAEPTGAVVPDLFPDRDLEVGGTYWHLVRRDSALAIDLDGVFPDRPAAARVHAHAYVRAPEDRTLTLAWHGPSCGDARAWLNGIPLAPPADPRVPAAAPGGAPPGGQGAGGPGTGRQGAEVREMTVRLAGGWNTLLLEIAVGECPARFGAWLSAPEGADAAARDGLPGDRLEGIRVQASRPPGVRRTYPAAWVTLSPGVPSLELTWQSGAEGLMGHLRLRLAGWGAPSGEMERRADERRREAEARRPRGDFPDPERTRQERLRQQLLPPPPPPEPAPRLVGLDVRAGSRTRETLRLPPSGRTAPASLPFAFGDLRRAALSSGAAELELRWRRDGDERSRRAELPLSPDALLRALHAAISLAGWEARTAGAEDPADPAGAATDRAPAIRGGEWRVPSALSGFGLELSIEGAPGRYRLDGRPLVREGDRLLLCRPCREGARLALEAEPEGEWTATPRVRIVEAGYPAAAGRAGSPPAEAWLRALRGGGNAEYLRLAAEHASPSREGGEQKPGGREDQATF